VVKILLSSAAIPAVFPPVQIGDSVYADGGVSANIFLRLDVREPTAYIPRWIAAHPDGPPVRVRYWVIVNNQLNHPPKTVQPRWPAIMGPSLATAIRSATLAEVRWLAAQADYVNTKYGTDIEVRVVGIPDSWRPPVEGDFKQETMASLCDLEGRWARTPDHGKCWRRRRSPRTPHDEIAATPRLFWIARWRKRVDSARARSTPSGVCMPGTTKQVAIETTRGPSADEAQVNIHLRTIRRSATPFLFTVAAWSCLTAGATAQQTKPEPEKPAEPAQ
jgi:hypothetical protein